MAVAERVFIGAMKAVAVARRVKRMASCMAI